MTLEQQIISEAPIGVTRRECPGGWRAYVAKRETGESRVFYYGTNDHPRHILAIIGEANAFAGLAIQGQAGAQ